jgi:hypothetical protein
MDDVITPEVILQLVRQAPVRLLDLAQSRSEKSRRRRAVIQALQTLSADGLVKRIYLDGAYVYVPTEWRIDDDRLQLLIDGQTRRYGDCMDWTGATHRGVPVLRLTAAMNRPDLPVFLRVGRWMWERHTGRRLSAQQTLKPICGSDTCVNPEHQKPQRRGIEQRGRAKSLAERASIARGVRQALGRLTPEQVRHIRESDAPSAELAARYCITSANVNHIRRGDTWREYVNNPWNQLLFMDCMPPIRTAAASIKQHGELQ